MSQYLMNNYARLPIAFERGQGAWLYDTNGQAYLDALSGIAVCGLGHAHPELSAILSEQAQQLWHVSNIFSIPQQEHAAEALCTISQMEKVFFCNSGTEANEAAIKLSRLHARQRSIERPIVITFNHSFHGRTFASMSATGNANIQQGFEPLVPGFMHLPYNDIDALKNVANDPNIVAVMLECIQGEGGINMIDEAFIHQLRELCNAHDWLMIVDDIQAGIGRTGQWFSYQHYHVLPDVLTLAKGLGNGLPVGACLANGKAAEYFQPGKHGTTFGGSPLVMQIVANVIHIYQRDHIPAHAAHMGEYLLTSLHDTFADHPNVAQIRGRGLMIGIELKAPIADLPLKALDQRLILNVTAGKVIRLLPTLLLNQDEADAIVERLAALLQASC